MNFHSSLVLQQFSVLETCGLASEACRDIIKCTFETSFAFTFEPESCPSRSTATMKTSQNYLFLTILNIPETKVKIR